VNPEQVQAKARDLVREAVALLNQAARLAKPDAGVAMLVFNGSGGSGLVELLGGTVMLNERQEPVAFIEFWPERAAKMARWINEDTKRFGLSDRWPAPPI
jgi:hypothetical protein